MQENYRMRTSFNNPTLMYRDGVIDEVTYGLLAAKSEAFDPIFVDDVCSLQLFYFKINMCCVYR